MLSFLHEYAANYFASQNGEEGLLIEIVRRLGIDEGRSVEVGGSDGLFCSNTALLIKDHAWHGLYVEADYNLYLKCKENWKHNPNVRSQCCLVDGKNINAFVDDSCDLLSIDTDGADYHIFRGLLSKPKIVIVEIDSSLSPLIHDVNPDGGVGYKIMVELGLEKGYFLLCHTGNLVFVDERFRHLFPEITGDPLRDIDLYFNRAWIKEAAA